MDEGAGGVDVEQVVIADFLAVELVEDGVEIAVVGSGLVWVFAIAEGLGAVDGYT